MNFGLATLLPALAVATALPAGPASARLVGGWGTTPATGEVMAAARWAAPRLPRPRSALRRVEAAEQQVVAGMNYRMTLVLADGRRFRVVVWQRVDGSYQLSEATALRRSR